MNKQLIDKILESISKGTEQSLQEYNDYDEIDYVFELKSLIKCKDDLSLQSILPLRARSEMSGFGGPFMIDGKNIKKLNESSARTYSYEELIKHYRNKLGIDPGFIKAEILANNVEVITLIVDAYDNLEFIKNAMEQFGWSFSNMKQCVYYGIPLIMVSFDPIYQNPINYEIIDNPILFHWTPNYLYDNIIKEGLLPKSENYKFAYPPKIHLMKGTISDIECNNIGKLLCINNKDIRNNGTYILLNVDTAKISNDIEYFYDPRYEFGYYTKQPICKESISKKLERKFK